MSLSFIVRCIIHPKSLLKNVYANIVISVNTTRPLPSRNLRFCTEVNTKVIFDPSRHSLRASKYLIFSPQSHVNRDWV